ncbi:zinc ribbon domain-containing protein, partial [Streptococcus suis]
VRVEDTHEPIVTNSIFEIANNLLLRDIQTGKTKPSLFAGLLFCRDCHSQMVQRKRHYKNTDIIYYICSTHNKGHG